MAYQKLLKKGMRLAAALLALGCGLGPVSTASADPQSPVTGQLEQQRDHFQATQWLRLANQFWETGDYPLIGHYCNLILTYYPDTYYATQAEKLLKKTTDPRENKRREYRRNNPGLFIR